jgi:hypothetical protein
MAKGPFRDSQAPYWISGARTDVPAAGPNPLLIDIVIDLSFVQHTLEIKTI